MWFDLLRIHALFTNLRKWNECTLNDWCLFYIRLDTEVIPLFSTNKPSAAYRSFSVREKSLLTENNDTKDNLSFLPHLRQIFGTTSRRSNTFMWRRFYRVIVTSPLNTTPTYTVCSNRQHADCALQAQQKVFRWRLAIIVNWAWYLYYHTEYVIL